MGALRDVSFGVRAGETFGVVGRNGSGKSTLLKLMAYIFAPTEGNLEVGGRVGSLLEIGAGFHPGLLGCRERLPLGRGARPRQVLCRRASGGHPALSPRSRSTPICPSRRTPRECSCGSASRSRSTSTPTCCSWTRSSRSATKPSRGSATSGSRASRPPEGHWCSSRTRRPSWSGSASAPSSSTKAAS